LVVIFLLGLWIPQRSLFDQAMYEQWMKNSPQLAPLLDRTGFTHIYSSPLTIGVWGLFFINLILSMWKRIPLVRKRVSLGDENLIDPASPFFTARRTIKLDEENHSERIQALLKKEGFVLFGTTSFFCGVKNRYSALANPLFHLCFVLVLLGSITGIYTRFVGKISVAEGESFTGESRQYKQPLTLPLIGGLPDVGFTVNRVVPEISGKTALQLTAEITDREGKRHTIQINRPYRTGAVSCVLKKPGIAPLLILRDRDGKELDGAYLRLDVLEDKEDSFTFAGYRFKANFYADYTKEGNREYSRSLEFKNPVLRLTAFDGERVVAVGALKVGESLDLGDRSVTFAEMPFWVLIQVVKEHGERLVYFSLFLASFALAWRLLLYRRDIVCRVEENDGRQVMTLAWRTEFYRALAEEELDKLMGKLMKRERE
jgi:hypothetical protein